MGREGEEEGMHQRRIPGLLEACWWATMPFTETRPTGGERLWGWRGGKLMSSHLSTLNGWETHRRVGSGRLYGSARQERDRDGG